MKEVIYIFKPMKRGDFPLIKSWLEESHVREWWGDPDEELALFDEALRGDDCWPFLIWLEGEAIGLIQYWRVREARNWAKPEEAIWLASLRDEVVGVDMTIGRADKISKGIGSTSMRQFCQELRAKGHQEIIIDPDSRNLRAIRAYQKAGFIRIGQYPESEGGTLLMRWHG